MPIEAHWIHLLFLPLAAGLFFLPGWLLGKCLGTPAPILTAFLGGCAIFFNSVLLLDALRIELNLVSLGLILTLWCAVLRGWEIRRRKRAGSTEAVPAQATVPAWRPHGSEWWWVLPVVMAGASVAARAVIDPLSGWDNITRWDYLARLMVLQQSLAHYPAITSEDFVYYGWCDGIPPLVPMLNFWLYSAGGAITPALTALRVIGETALVGAACFKLSQRWWGASAGWPALAVLATSALFLWSCANGQETGLLGVSLASLVLFLELQRTDPRPGLAAWVGIAAGIGAISRDYGVAFVLFAVIALLATRPSRRMLAGFSAAALLVAGPWYLRNWVITGNPLYPHTFGGLFPGNPVHTEMMRSIARHWGLTAGAYDPRELPGIVAATAGVALLLGLAGALRGARRTVRGIGALGLVVGLWWWALPFTAGGWTYATRVLGPGVVIASALAGWVALSPALLRRVMMIAILVLATDAARRSWVMPMYPQASPWPYTWQTWRATKQELADMQRPQIWSILIAEAKGKGILVDHPTYQVSVLAQGGRPIPWFSPQIRPLLESGVPLPDMLTQLRANGVRFITLFSGNPMTDDFCTVYPGLRELTTRYAPTANANRLRIYDLEMLVPAKSPP